MNIAEQKQSLLAYSHFLNTSLEKTIQQSLAADTESAILALFKSVETSVPAYREFLAEHNISSAQIQTREQFNTLPLITKENYIRPYSLEARCRGGTLNHCDMLATSSGSTGQPTAWPRSLADELKVATRFEQIFHDSFQADKKSTLAVICFALGTWVGGLYTANCCRYLAQKGYRITVVTPGNNMQEILRVVQTLGHSFEQTVLLGYPPFIKDVIDTGIASGVDWPQYDIKLVMAGEVFSEEWRDWVGDRLSPQQTETQQAETQQTGTQQKYYNSASLYGTADAGVLGNETPLSIYIRRFLSTKPEAAKELFGESRLPTLVQYDPAACFFESDGRQLILSINSSLPLLRYNIKDTGGLISYADMLEFLASHGCDPIAALGTNRGIRPLPFVYVFGRSDFTVSYFGANIYPENIAVGLEQPDIRDWVTGKFVMQVVEDAERDRFLSIVVELAPTEQESAERTEQITESILAQLLRLNSEFANYVSPNYQRPRVALAKMGDPNYFPVGVKHRYTRR